MNKNKKTISKDILETLNITLIFTNPLNNTETITHREIINGVPQKKRCNKPFGWDSKTIIELNYNGTIIKKDLTIYYIIVRCTSKYQRTFIIENNKGEHTGPIIGCDPNKKTTKPNHSAKGMDFKTRTNIILEDGSEYTYTIKFKILSPCKCSNILE